MTLRTLPAGRRAPSRVNMWEGDPVEGSPWTRQQLKTCATQAPARAPYDTHKVKLQPEPTSLQASLPDPVYVDCPIIARRKDGTRVKIVTPNGFTAWVTANAELNR